VWRGEKVDKIGKGGGSWISGGSGGSQKALEDHRRFERISESYRIFHRIL